MASAAVAEAAEPSLRMAGRELEAAPALGEHLVALDLSRNQITELPESIGGCTALMVMDVSRNRLKVLPSTLGGCLALESLNVFGNHLRTGRRSVPLEALAALPNFKLLDARLNTRFKMRPPLAELPGVIVLVSPPAPVFPNKEFAGDRDASDLQAQLEPYSIAQLRTRLEDAFGEVLPARVGEAVRWEVMERLLQCYAACGTRTLRRVPGVLLPVCLQPLLPVLLTEMRATAWPPHNERERPKINASGYIILAKPQEEGTTRAAKTLQKVQKHARIWDLAAQVIEGVDPDFATKWTALALTKQFKGSPHIDHDNIGPFYGLALGDFQGGGICVEAGPFEVVEVDTKEKMGKADGRFPHWVAPYEGERYSLIFYQTWGDATPQSKATFQDDAQPAYGGSPGGSPRGSPERDGGA